MMFSQYTARKAISRRLRIGLALVAATGAIAGTGASSAMAGTPHECIQYADGALVCAEEFDADPSFELVTGTAADGSQGLYQVPDDVWHEFYRQQTGIAIVVIGPSTDDSVDTIEVPIGVNLGANDIWSTL